MAITGWEFTGIILLVIITLFADAFWFEKFFIRVNEFYIGAATKRSENIKVVQLSDLHLQSITGSLMRLAKRLNKLQPDLIVITGDAIDKARNISLLNEFLQLLDKNIQKVAILGNWEYQGKIDLVELHRMYERNNCKLLINQSVKYSFKTRTILVTGLDDYLRGNADFDRAIKGYQKSDYHIMLTHCPKYSDDISQKIKEDVQVDFILSGHTHGGQFNLFGMVPFLPGGSGKYVSGWYNNRHPKLYVSKGIGTVFFPARIGARAEIAIFNLVV
ncbi:MAG: metallophosphoesterase [Ferruginibacter sp.]